MLKKIKILSLILACYIPCVQAQQIAIDRGVKVEGLWCFPLATDSTQYLFLPDQSHLAVDNQQHPQFSFVRYVNDMVVAKDSGNNSIKQAGGGGILHFLLTYDTDEKKVRKAASKLKELLGNDEVKLRGPIVFTQGRFALVSSVLNPANGNAERQLLAMGEAPVLEGSRLALSFEIDPQRSKLLLESFKMSTPDISIIFDLTFEGLTDSYNAKLTVDWSEVSKYEKMGGGINVYFVSADVEKIYEELQRRSAIKLETSGNNANMDALVNNAYNKLTDLIFRKVEPEQLDPVQRDNITSLLGGLFSNQGGGPFSSGKLFGFGAHAAYKLKDIKTSGSSTLYFKSRISTERHHYITFNIGDIYKKYGSNTEYFRAVSLLDPVFARRDIYVNVDGALLPEFDKLINSVTVTLKKQHTNGNATVREVTVSKNSAGDPRLMGMSYDAVGDSDQVEWLNYEYRAQYQFKGGKNYVTPWQQQNASMINLFVPYERKTIRFEGDLGTLKNNDVRAVIVQVEYAFFGERRKIETFLRPDDSIQNKQFDITLPLNQFKYHYTLTWKFRNGSERTMSGDNDNELLFIDVMPAQ